MNKLDQIMYLIRAYPAAERLNCNNSLGSEFLYELAQVCYNLFYVRTLATFQLNNTHASLDTWLR